MNKMFTDIKIACDELCVAVKTKYLIDKTSL